MSPVIGEAMLPVDITQSSAPFLSVGSNTSAAAASPSDWSHVPLYTNLYTGTIPATIHHNARQHGMKSLLLEKTWGWSDVVGAVFEKHVEST
jgi:hypothetical protein